MDWQLIYAFIAGGKKGVKAFWKNVLPSTLTALATCSSAASIPVNVECAKKVGVPGVALLATLLVTAVPIGGGTISEMLIITMMVTRVVDGKDWIENKD